MALHPDFMDNEHLRDVLYQHFKQYLARAPRAELCSIAEGVLRDFCDGRPQLNRVEMGLLWEFWVEMAYLDEEPLAPIALVYVYLLDEHHPSQYHWAGMSDAWVQQTLTQAMPRAAPVWLDLREAQEPISQHYLSSPSLNDGRPESRSLSVSDLSHESMSQSAYHSGTSRLSDWVIRTPGSTPPNQSEGPSQSILSPITLPPAAHWLLPRVSLPENT